MLILDKKLLDDLKIKNVILRDGFINTRYKAMIKHSFMTLWESLDKSKNIRQQLFHKIYDLDVGRCMICDNLTNFEHPNFLDPESQPIYSNVCSKKCQYELVSILQSIRRNDPDIEKNRIKSFKNTVKAIQDDGALKAAKTKLNTIVDGKNGIVRQVEKTKQTRYAKGSWIDPSSLSEFQQYRRKVYDLTKLQPIHLLKNHEKRGHFLHDGYHLDHVFSIFEGYKNKIPVETISDITNLRFIPAIQNTTKSYKSDILMGFLFMRFHEHHSLNISLEDLSRSWNDL